jgi:DNA polymerase III epsilon subunit-like protein
VENKYVSIDIETTSDNPETGEILSFGAVIEDLKTKKPIEKLSKFHVYLKSNSHIKGNHYALAMNAPILDAISGRVKSDIEIIKHDELEFRFYDFLIKNGFQEKNFKIIITVAGKNFAGFDAQFIKKLNWNSVIFRSRVIDVGSLMWDKKSLPLPALAECKKIAKIKSEVSHDALDDAIDVIKCIRYVQGI